MRNIFIFHGTEGYPEENWFPWFKEKLEEMGHEVFVPQFPSPPAIPAKIDEWFEVLKSYEQHIDRHGKTFPVFTAKLSHSGADCQSRSDRKSRRL